jgi:hypothetical protein
LNQWREGGGERNGVDPPIKGTPKKNWSDFHWQFYQDWEGFIYISERLRRGYRMLGYIFGPQILE